MADFRPPLNNGLIIELSRTALLPAVLWWNRYESVEVDQRLIDTFQQLEGKRTIICSTHSHRHDPIILFLLSQVLDQQFNYVAAREIFDWWKGFCGWGLQRHGVYSVNRGTLDRQSMAMTKKLILDGERRLVVFPECEISGRDDKLLPVERGLVSLFMRSTHELQKVQPGEPVYVLPIALQYRYLNDVSGTLSNAMLRIEKELGIAAFEADLQRRLARIVKRLVAIICTEFGVTVPDDISQPAQIDRAIERLLEYCAQSVSFSLPSQADPIESARLLRAQVDAAMAVRKETSAPYQRSLHKHMVARNREFNRILETVRRLYALQDFVRLPKLSQENLATGVELVEREVFGRVTQKGKRAVLLTSGTPINLADRHQQYQRDKRSEVNYLAESIEQQLSELLGIAPAKPSIAA